MKLSRAPKKTWLTGLTVIVLSLVNYSQSLPVAVKPQPTPAISPTPGLNLENQVATPAVPAIPLQEVVVRAEESSQLVNDIIDRISQLPELEAEEQQLRLRQELLFQEARATERALVSSPDLSELWRQEQSWNHHRVENGKMRGQLGRRASNLTDEIQLLDTQLTRWQAMLQQTAETEDLKEVFARIRAARDDIQIIKDQLAGRQRKLVILENQISQQAELIAYVLDLIGEARRQFEGSILVQNSYPLWDRRAYQQTYQTLTFNFGSSFLNDLRSSQQLIRLYNPWVIVSALLFILSIVLVFILRRTEQIKDETQKLGILKYPVSMALPVLLFSVIIFNHTSLPLGIINLLTLVMIIPILRITTLLIESSFKPLLYAFLAVLLIDVLRKLITASLPTERLILAIAAAAAIGVFAWPAFKLRQQKFTQQTLALRIAIPGVWLMILLLTISLLANILGYLKLAEVILEGALFSCFLAIVLLTGVRAAGVVIALLLRSPGAGRIAIFRLHGSAIQAGYGRVLAAVALLVWLVAALEFFTIRDHIFREIEQGLKRQISIGALRISAWDVILFFLVLIGGIVLARIIRFVVQEEILARLPLRHGLPNAISTLGYYILLVAVFLMSLVAAGVELTRFTVLTGALGVGVGIGLQNIVNNFVSGVILLFERPIRPGDVVEVAGVEGKVKHIGVRASTIQTDQGAQVIVPNADLILKHVINWTFDHRQRRVHLPVRVAYGVELPRVIQILEEAAAANPAVLPNPKPSVEFIGFGEGGLQLELQFWLLQDERYISAKNDVAAAANEALRAAGIEMWGVNFHILNAETLGNES